MNKITIILALFLTINGFFSLFNYIMPATSGEKVLSLQLWINAILLLATFLPSTVAPFLYSI
jgi:hypothetical protein